MSRELKEYGLFFKNSDERIAKLKAYGVDEALQRFAEVKKLSPTNLLKIFRIKQL